MFWRWQRRDRSNLYISPLSTVKTTNSLLPQEQLATLNLEKINWFRDRLRAWGEQHLRNYPWRQTSEPYPILIAEFLLQKTDADTVVPVYQAFANRMRLHSAKYALDFQEPFLFV